MSNATLVLRSPERQWPSYDAGLVALCFLIAVQAAYVSVTILKAHHFRPMVVLGALTFSVGSIFCMHFVAMAAETNVVPMNMNPGWTTGSIFFAFVPTAAAMVFLTSNIPIQEEHPNTILGNWQAFKSAPHLALIGGALLMALGTAAMHWTATIGMYSDCVAANFCEHRYDPLWVAICCVYLLVACAIALYCCFVLPLTRTFALPTAIVLSLATTGFHIWAAVLSQAVYISPDLAYAMPHNEMRQNAPYIVFLSGMMSFIAWFIATHFVRNSLAPTDETKPVTIVFTDVQQSSRLWSKIPTVMQHAIEKHNQILNAQLVRHNGFFVKSVGDSYVTAFKNPLDAIAWMMDCQVMLNNAQWDPKINWIYRKLAHHGRLEHNNPGGSSSQPQSDSDHVNSNNNPSTSNPQNAITSRSPQVSSSAHSKTPETHHLGPSAIATRRQNQKQKNSNDSQQSSGNTENDSSGGGENKQNSHSNSDGIGEKDFGEHWNGLRVRMGAHQECVSIIFDEVEKKFDYYGNGVNCCARIESAARGGQILISQHLLKAVGGENGIQNISRCIVESHGNYALKGIGEPIELIEITPEALSLRRPFAKPNATLADQVDFAFENSVDDYIFGNVDLDAIGKNKQEQQPDTQKTEKEEVLAGEQDGSSNKYKNISNDAGNIITRHQNEFIATTTTTSDEATMNSTLTRVGGATGGNKATLEYESGHNSSPRRGAGGGSTLKNTVEGTSNSVRDIMIVQNNNNNQLDAIHNVPPHVVVVHGSEEYHNHPGHHSAPQQINTNNLYASLDQQQASHHQQHVSGGFNNSGSSVNVTQQNNNKLNNNNNQQTAIDNRRSSSFQAPNPDDVFEFVLSTVHRLVRKRYSEQAVKQKLEQQIQALEILLCNMKDVFEKRRIVAKISKSWGHHSAFTAYAEDENDNNNNNAISPRRTSASHHSSQNKSNINHNDMSQSSQGGVGVNNASAATDKRDNSQSVEPGGELFVRFDMLRSVGGTNDPDYASNGAKHHFTKSGESQPNINNITSRYVFPEDIQEAEKEIKSALIVLCGRVITRLMHLETFGSQSRAKSAAKPTTSNSVINLTAVSRKTRDGDDGSKQ
jgi:class 3 adenylate cyclase/NO-binding membrane sensor protein with MHYT domain